MFRAKWKESPLPKAICPGTTIRFPPTAWVTGSARGEPDAVTPDRIGVVLGADRICAPLDESEMAYANCMTDGVFDYDRWGTDGLAASFPLGFLRVLPNMIASHVSIAHNAQGPNNTIHLAEMSGLLAVAEATDVIRRGWADVMIGGGASSQTALPVNRGNFISVSFEDMHITSLSSLRTYSI